MGKVIIVIDKKRKMGKQVVSLLKNLSYNHSGIVILSEKDVDDLILEILMRHGAKSGLVDRKKVLKKLGILSK